MVLTYPEPKSIGDVLNEILQRLEALEHKASKKK